MVLNEADSDLDWPPSQWLHRSGFQMGGFGRKVVFHDPQSSQQRFNFIFGTRNANTCMLRYETWARRFTTHWHVNEYCDEAKKEPADFSVRAKKCGVFIVDKKTHEALTSSKAIKPHPHRKSIEAERQKRLIKEHAPEGTAAAEVFAKLASNPERQEWLIKAAKTAAGEPTPKSMADVNAEYITRHSCLKASKIPHCHLSTWQSDTSKQFVRKLYAQWYEDMADERCLYWKTKVENGEEQNNNNDDDKKIFNFWPSEKYDESVMEAVVLGYHRRQANHRFGWLVPHLGWKFSATWAGHNGVKTERVVVDVEFDVLSRMVPFRIEAKLDAAVDGLWYAMKMTAPPPKSRSKSKAKASAA